MQFLAFTIYYWYMFLYIGLNFLPDSTSMLSNLKILFKISPVKSKHSYTLSKSLLNFLFFHSSYPYIFLNLNIKKRMK